MATTKISKALRERVMSAVETPRVTFRFFIVTEGPILDELKIIRDWNDRCFKAAEKLGKSFGARSAASYRGTWLYQFSKAPDTLWKRELRHGGKDYYKPVQKSGEGRRIAAAIKQLDYPRDASSALSAIGLFTGPAVVEGHTWYRPVLWGWWADPLFLVKVPWRHFDPEILDAYKLMRTAGEYGCGAYDHALWAPHSSMREVKEWEALKIDAEHREGA